MSGYGKLWTSIMCLDQLLTSKARSNFNLRYKITGKNCIRPHFYFLTHEKFAPPYTHPRLAHNLLSSDWLRVPLL